MKKIIGLFLLLFSINGYCEWTIVSVNETKTTSLFVDLSTKKSVGGYVRVWILLSRENSDSRFKSFKSLEEIDCSGERKRTLQMTPYTDVMGGGSSLGTEYGDGRWSYIVPGAMESFMFKRVCR